MGIFKKRKTQQPHRLISPSTRASIAHHASWGSNGATFFVNREGVTWSYDSSPSFMDEPDFETALSQLERAYHLNVSFPDAEVSMMRLLRQMNPDISEASVPFYEWTPPLPGS
jgi:hypothetical protein